MIVAGRVSQKMAPVLRQIYDQMAEPKWVLAMGVCASSGGMFNNYAIVQGVDHVVPVDMYLPGCPPRPEMLMDAILKLHDQVQHTKLGVEPRAADRRAGDRRAQRAADLGDEGAAAVSDTGQEPEDLPEVTQAPTRAPPTRPRRTGARRPRAAPARGGRRPPRHVRRRRAPATPPATAAWSAPSRCPADSAPPYGGWFDEVADALPGALERAGVRRTGDAIEKVVVHRGEITFFIRREHLLADREAAARRRDRCASRCARGLRRALPRRRRAASCTRSTTCSR